MKTVAVVPLNTPDAAKTRLASVLPGAARQALVRWLAGRVLAALHASAVLAEVAVLSPSAEVLAWAEAEGAVPLVQHGGDLNDGLGLAREWAQARGAEALLVVLGDLPLLLPEEVAALVRQARHVAPAPVAVHAPDRARRGTNALLLHPPELLPFAFGEGSLARHAALARAAGVVPRYATLPGLAFDVDTVADVRELARRGLWSQAAATDEPLKEARDGIRPAS